jgi:ankyrin repeat and LEM domain-containing protein 1
VSVFDSRCDIFYFSGKRSRPYSHLYQALTLWKRDFTTSKDKKVQKILDIWKDKVGVVCLHIFQNVIPAEAYTYEAAMIDVLGLNNLKNLKAGNYYGVAASWPHKERRMFGLYLLYKAMQIFLSEGERQLRPDDID